MSNYKIEEAVLLDWDTLKIASINAMLDWEKTYTWSKYYLNYKNVSGFCLKHQWPYLNVSTEELLDRLTESNSNIIYLIPITKKDHSNIQHGGWCGWISNDN